MENFDIFDKCTKGIAHRFFRTYNEAFLAFRISEEDLVAEGWTAIMEVTENPKYSGKSIEEIKKIISKAVVCKLVRLKEKSKEYQRKMTALPSADFDASFEEDYSSDDDLGGCPAMSENDSPGFIDEIDDYNFGELDEVLKSKLTDSEYQVLVEIFKEKKTLEEMGLERGVKKSRMCQIKKDILLKLNKYGMQDFLKKY